MPEGPELFLAAKFIRDFCRSLIFDKIVKSDVSKNPPIPWKAGSKFRLGASSRGKELLVHILPIKDKDNEDCWETDGEASTASEAAADCSTQKSKNNDRFLLIRFGMSGQISLHNANSIPKHAHIQFFTSDGQKALCFVDPRRFGRWILQDEMKFSSDRGPCPIQNYAEFRRRVLSSLQHSAFRRPICETLLDQEFFNGIGNYLRAEIMFRAKVNPFTSARTILEPLAAEAESAQNSDCDSMDLNEKSEDILWYCHSIPWEVIDLCTPSLFEKSSVSEDNESRDFYYGGGDFSKWLQCYDKKGMQKKQDKMGRAVWYSTEQLSIVHTASKTTTKTIVKKEVSIPVTDPNSAADSKVKKGRKRSLPSSAESQTKTEEYRDVVVMVDKMPRKNRKESNAKVKTEETTIEIQTGESEDVPKKRGRKRKSETSMDDKKSQKPGRKASNTSNPAAVVQQFKGRHTRGAVQQLVKAGLEAGEALRMIM